MTAPPPNNEPIPFGALGPFFFDPADRGWVGFNVILLVSILINCSLVLYSFLGGFFHILYFVAAWTVVHKYDMLDTSRQHALQINAACLIERLSWPALLAVSATLMTARILLG